MTVTYTNLSICTDCVAVLSNGTDNDPALEAVAEAIEENWGEAYLVPMVDRPLGFCSGMCNGCGTRLAGDRWEAEASE